MRTQLGFDEVRHYPWSTWLPKIQYNLNIMISEATMPSAHELAFGQPAHTNVFPEANIEGHVIDEDAYNKSMEKKAQEEEDSEEPTELFVSGIVREPDPCNGEQPHNPYPEQSGSQQPGVSGIFLVCPICQIHTPHHQIFLQVPPSNQ